MAKASVWHAKKKRAATNHRGRQSLRLRYVLGAWQRQKLRYVEGTGSGEATLSVTLTKQKGKPVPMVNFNCH